MIGDGALRPPGRPSIEPDGEAGCLDFQLHAFLATPSDDPSRTWATRVAESLVAAAARGDARSWGLLFRRAGAGRAATRPVVDGVDDETARRILEAACGIADDVSFD